MSRLIRLQPRGDHFHTSRNRAVLITDRNGFIREGTDQGFFVYETRLLSRYRYLVDGSEPMPAGLSNVEQHTWHGYYLVLPESVEVEPKDEGSGMLPPVVQKTMELRVSREVGNTLREELAFRNFTGQRAKFTFQIDLSADFAANPETIGARQQNGEVKTSWRDHEGCGELRFDYCAPPRIGEGEAGEKQGECGFSSALRVLIDECTSSPSFRDGCLVFAIELEQQAVWQVRLTFLPLVDRQKAQSGIDDRKADADAVLESKKQSFLQHATQFSTPLSATLSADVIQTVEQARQDLADLRLHDLDRGSDAWVPAAGSPIYLGLFGRDTLTTAWQASMLSRAIMRGTLPELAAWQGRVDNEWRDEEPGRMIHEAHTGPLEILGYNPRLRNYGSITTSGFFPVALAEFWHWTGDKELVGSLIDPALRALRWLDERSDRDQDGFYEYQTRSEQGVKHQAWKDSPDAIVDEDGTPVEPPIATCEEQGFVYLAKLLMSEVLWWFDRKEEGRGLYRQAQELKKRFNETFWLEDERFIALGIAAGGRRIRSITSNPGHCLATGIVDAEVVEPVVRRLMSPEMWSGWGIRTLSDQNPAYNPYSYHRGSVWPVENGTFALAFLRYGLFEEMDRLCKAQFEAAALFEYHRLPELFAGHPRDAEHPFPGLYPKANSPQAWSASAVFCMLQALLGIYPYAPLHVLAVDPHLPAWLPDITLRNLSVGDAVVDLRFHRDERGRSDYQILEQRGLLHVIRQPSPWSLTASFAERVKDVLSSMVK